MRCRCLGIGYTHLGEFFLALTLFQSSRNKFNNKAKTQHFCLPAHGRTTGEHQAVLAGANLTRRNNKLRLLVDGGPSYRCLQHRAASLVMELANVAAKYPCGREVKLQCETLVGMNSHPNCFSAA